MTKNIALIGFGAANIMSFYNLVDKASENSLEIDIFDDEFKAGIAYSTTNINHLLNVRATNISAVYEDNNHFVNWLKENNYDYSELSFVPRKIYGLYLESIVTKACEIADEKGIKYSFNQQKIANIIKQNDEFVINEKPYQYCILAVGGEMGEKNFWKINIDDYLKDKEIHLLGAGLTAFDAIISLIDKGYKGTIYLHSRTNRLPQIHSQKFHDNSVSLVLTIQDAQLPLSHIFHKFTKLCKKANDWRAVFDSIRSITPQLWQNFDAAKKARFMRHCFRLWNTHRHRCPQEQYDKINDLIAKGKVILTKEKIATPKYIECLGFNFSLQNKLLEALLQNKIIAKDELNLGVKSNFSNFAIIGANNFGSLFETTAISELKNQAYVVANRLV